MSVISSEESAEKELAELQEQLKQLHKTLSAERQRAQWSARITAFVGTVCLLAITCYFAYGYHRFRQVTEPENIVDVAQTLVDDNLPKARAALEKEVIKSAPEWAEGLSRKAQDSMPEARKKVQQYFVEETERTLDEVAVLSEKQFREFLRKNKPTLEKKYKELAESPELAEKSLQELELPLDEAFQTEMRTLAARASRDLTSANQNLIRLKERKNLTQEQEIERQVWMIVRRLQLEYVDDTPRAGLASKPPLHKAKVPDKAGKDKAKQKPAKTAEKPARTTKED
jgi:hypothetical protein